MCKILKLKKEKNSQLLAEQQEVVQQEANWATLVGTLRKAGWCRNQTDLGIENYRGMLMPLVMRDAFLAITGIAARSLADEAGCFHVFTTCRFGCKTKSIDYV